MAAPNSKNASRRLWQQRPVTYTINPLCESEIGRCRGLDRPKPTAWNPWRCVHPSIQGWDLHGGPRLEKCVSEALAAEAGDVYHQPLCGSAIKSVSRA